MVGKSEGQRNMAALLPTCLDLFLCYEKRVVHVGIGREDDQGMEPSQPPGADQLEDRPLLVIE